MLNANAFDLNFKTALVIGGTGLIGSYLLRNLIHHPSFKTVTSLSRNSSGLKSLELREYLIDFNRIDELDDRSYGFDSDILFITLGTTIKAAGSKAAFERVDLEYALRVAQKAKAAGCKQCHVVTAMGANEHSKIFYNRVKGKVECQLKKLDFESLHIYRPSLLLGKRKQRRNKERIGQLVMQGLAPTMLGPLKTYQPIHAETVAEAMLKRSIEDYTGDYVLHSKAIKQIADPPQKRKAVELAE
ncbi:MAG: NAD-dependent epimerase/dehydratase family protein [Bacteroidota bacterium]